MTMSTNELVHALNVLQDNDLNISNALALFALEAIGVGYQKNLKLSYSSARLSMSITKLIKCGFVSEVPDKADNRCKHIFLTEAGHKLINQILNIEK